MSGLDVWPALCEKGIQPVHIQRTIRSNDSNRIGVHRLGTNRVINVEINSHGQNFPLWNKVTQYACFSLLDCDNNVSAQKVSTLLFRSGVPWIVFDSIINNLLSS